MMTVSRDILTECGRHGVAGMGLSDKALNSAFSAKDDAAISFLNYQAFTMSVVEGELITDALKQRIGDTLKLAKDEGWSRNKFKTHIQQVLGIGAKGYHLETVWRTNTATAANASRLMAFERNKALFPMWEFVAIEDGDTTPICRANDGRKYAHGDNRFFPPLHFNCRSEASPIDVTEVEDEGYSTDDPPSEPIPDGFTNTAVASFEQWAEDIAKTNPNIAARMKDAPKPRKSTTSPNREGTP